jgi:hypothetical protein
MSDDRIITCVYCGEEYPVGTPASGAHVEVLTKHIAICPKHPMALVVKELEAVRKELEAARAVLYCADMFEKCAEDHSKWDGPSNAVFDAVIRWRKTQWKECDACGKKQPDLEKCEVTGIETHACGVCRGVRKEARP